MKQLIVLDKSALRGIAHCVHQEALKSREYLLPYQLYYEVDTSSSFDDAQQNIKKLSALGLCEYLREPRSLIQWEICQGLSAGESPYRIKSSATTASPISHEDSRKMAEQSEHWAQVVSIPHNPRYEAEFQKLQNVPELEFWPWLSTNMVYEVIVARTIEVFRSKAGKCGLDISGGFKPTRDWFCYGLVLASDAFFLWKCRFVGDGSPTKADHCFHDIGYLACMALADGLMSCDKVLLNLAWACWPEKRDCIYSYDSMNKRVCQYRPDWES